MGIGALVLAAGSGTRLGRRKQFLPLRGSERLVDRAVATARSVAPWVGVVVPADHRWTGPSVEAVVAGGDSRYDSLQRGLDALPDDVDTVLVHSASHPLASVGLASALLEAVGPDAAGAVPFLPVVDVIKRRTDQGLVTVGREGFGTAQCPMAFDRAALDRAFAEVPGGTEESELVERSGGRIVAVDGEVTNVHVVDEASLALASAIAQLDPPGDVSPSPEPPV